MTFLIKGVLYICFEILIDNLLHRMFYFFGDIWETTVLILTFICFFLKIEHGY